MLKLCPNCSAELPAHARFCNKCGAEILAQADGFPAWGWALLGVGMLGVFAVCFAIGLFLWRTSPASAQTPTALPASATPAPGLPIATRSVSTSTPRPTLTTEPAKNMAEISGEVSFAAMRNSPGYVGKNDNRDVIVEIPAGSQVEILEGSQSADGLRWWLVSWNDYQGWVAERTGSGKTILVFNP